jgi:biopolymer transport protein ExbD
MAEVSTTPAKGPGTRQRKRSTRIDMTAMVDVAFLLLTFFILTTTLAQPTALELNVPTEGPGGQVPCSNTLQVFLGADHKAHVDLACSGNLQTIGLDAMGLRKMVETELKANPALIVSIKGTNACTWRDVVDVLDEMKIVGAKRYAFASASPDDMAYLESKGL